MSVIVYRISKSFFLTTDVVRRLEGRISILFPSTRQAVVKRVGRQLLKIYSFGILTAIILFLFADMSVYYTAIVAATVYVVADSSIHKGLDKLEISLLNQFLRFIETVKFRFQFDGMVEEALLDAIRDSGYEMGVHGQIIYDHLKESYFKERCDYQEISPNHFFLTFYSLCESVMKYGDKKTEEGSLFIKNLGYLKEDINLELLKRKSIENTFMGITGICILPVYCIKPIEAWAISNMPELVASYAGKSGIISTIMLTVMSLTVYQVIKSLKYPVTPSSGKSNWVEWLYSKEAVRSINTHYMNCFLKRMIALEKLLRSIAYPYNIAEFCIKRMVSSLLFGVVALILGLSTGFGTASLLIGLLCFVIVYCGQVTAIRLKRQLMLLEREDEIIRFQSIILMLIHADRITVEQILSQLERFAISFKREIEEISDKLSYKGMAIFKEFRDKSDFLPFNRIIDGFIACDDMYIYKAFEDVETDRRYYIEKHKQENTYYIEQRGAIGKFLSFIPLCAVILVKLVVPFVMEGMRQMAAGNMSL